jgi:cytochrome c
MARQMRRGRPGTMQLFLGASAASLVLSATAATAQVHPDAKTGHEIASKLCSGCHIVDSTSAGAAMSADVPTFEEIANQPGQTAQTIAGRIVIPHPPMPTINLTRVEIGDVAAYILSMRKPKSP